MGLPEYQLELEYQLVLAWAEDSAEAT
jgi:hypothetical protein